MFGVVRLNRNLFTGQVITGSRLAVLGSPQVERFPKRRAPNSRERVRPLLWFTELKERCRESEVSRFAAGYANAIFRDRLSRKGQVSVIG